ncbi:hypothetical protein [Caballeronia sp. Sq4a]|uniref:hypothetical protein n=1 Tax=Caballeronia sp. Sq4a TaxID=2878152 RepID=UPI0020C0D3F2|nr:hypothetical protein [Caballeronia sp. Sq4a]
MQPAIERGALESEKSKHSASDKNQSDKSAGKNNECFGAHAVSVAGFSGPR